MIKGEAGPRPKANDKRRAPSELSPADLANVVGGAREEIKKSAQEEGAKQ